MEIGADSSLRFGLYLRQERERRSITLEEIARATRFSVRHLQSLEADLFDELPGGILRKGLVRGYCQYLGLEPDAWLERFAASGGLDNGEHDLSHFAENVHRARLEATPPVRHRWWGVLGMVVALLLLAYATWHYLLGPRLGLHWRERTAQSNGTAHANPAAHLRAVAELSARSGLQGRIRLFHAIQAGNARPLP